jgi:hypothetical protein
MAEPWRQVVHTVEPRRRQEVTLEVIPVLEASRWRWTMTEIIGVLEVFTFDDVARWARVASSFVGHENICKSQRVVMTL